MAKVIFLHLFAILFTGGVLPQCMLGYQPPPWTRQISPDQADPPRTRPPGPGTPHPPGKQTPAYGLRAAGTHPTGMHSCFLNDNCVVLQTTREQKKFTTIVEEILSPSAFWARLARAKGTYTITNCLPSDVCCYCRRRHCHCLLAAFLCTYRQSSSSPPDLFLAPTHVVCVEVMVSVVFVCLSTGGMVPMSRVTLDTPEATTQAPIS